MPGLGLTPRGQLPKSSLPWTLLGVGTRKQLCRVSHSDVLEKKLLGMQEIPVQSLGRKDPLENGNPLQRILWTEKLEGLQSMGLQRVGQD